MAVGLETQKPQACEYRSASAQNFGKEQLRNNRLSC